MVASSSASMVPWHGIREAPVVLVMGPESFLADRAMRILTDRMKAGHAEVEISDLDASVYA
ncbi:MAG TPA: DNA polymerase III subunit delta, partial [Microbacteriaceae bacterium]|nr:DNA polymerase III subunit delta [Microbacteriaceae bacterium]